MLIRVGKMCFIEFFFLTDFPPHVFSPHGYKKTKDCYAASGYAVMDADAHTSQHNKTNLA